MDAHEGSIWNLKLEGKNVDVDEDNRGESIRWHEDGSRCSFRRSGRVLALAYVRIILSRWCRYAHMRAFVLFRRPRAVYQP